MPDPVETLLVTGATGRAGGAVLDALAGHVPLRAASRSGRAVGDVPGVAFDMADPATFAQALSGIRAIFLIRPPAITDRKVIARFLDAASAAGATRILCMSVIGADRFRILPHHGMEAEVMARPFDWTMLRPSDFMQNLETVLAPRIRARDEISVPAGRGRSAFIDVADIGALAAHVLATPGHCGQGYDLTGPESLDFTEVVRTLSRILDRPIHYRPVNPAAFLMREFRAGSPFPLPLVMTALYTAQRLGLAEAVTDTLPRLLGRPAGTLSAYVSRNGPVWAPDTSRAPL